MLAVLATVVVLGHILLFCGRTLFELACKSGMFWGQSVGYAVVINARLMVVSKTVPLWLAIYQRHEEELNGRHHRLNSTGTQDSV